jgi:hypothetical protein
MKVFRTVTMEQFVLVDPDIAFSINFSKGIKVELIGGEERKKMRYFIQQCFQCCNQFSWSHLSNQ